MRSTCKICWIILGLFLLGNVILLGVWWIDNDTREGRNIEQFDKQDHRLRMREHLLQHADIDEEQFDKIYSLWKSHSQQMYNYQMEIDSLRQLLMNETFSEKPDSEAVDHLFDELSDKQRKIEETNYKHFRKLRSVCETDQQREMLDKLFRSKIMNDDRKKRFRGRRHKH